MASGGVYAETLELPKVPDVLVAGSKFMKWDDESGLFQTCTLKIDSHGYVIYWKFEEKPETDLLDIVQICDVRTGIYARMPKDSRLREQLRARISSSKKFENHCITVLFGPNFVDTNAVNFVAFDVNDAKAWFDCLMPFAQHVLPANASPLSFLEKHYTKLLVQANPDDTIPVKLITKYLASSKDDKKKVYDTLQSLGLSCKKEDSINICDFSLDIFLLFMSRLCNRQDIDKIFAEIGAKKKPYLTVSQFVEFLNTFQRDPRLNEILFPYYNDEGAKNLIDIYEPNKQFAEKGLLSVQGFTRYLLSEHNTVVNNDRLALHQDMNAPLSHYFVNSSHNTYLTGSQLKSQSSVEIYRQALLSGCRCVELDCWNGSRDDQEPCITHGMTLCTEVSFKDVIEAIAESAFKTSDYPVILSFENHCGQSQQKKMAEYCVSIFGDMLLDKPLDDFPLEDGKPLPSPKALMRKIIIKNKKMPNQKLEEAKVSASSISASSISASSISASSISASSISSAPENPSSTGNETTSPDVTDDETSQSETQVDELSDSAKSDGESLKDMIEKSKDKKEEPEEVDSENVLSDLVNYIQPIHFKSFDASEARNKSYEMTSFVETVATTLLKQEPVEFVNYNKRQLSRIYPKGTRVGSENYMPQVFWNAGCQLVALNFQTLDVPMMLNLGKFEYNGKCGYIRKPDFMCRNDRSFDPFAESTVDGIIAGSVEIRIISGQFLSDRKVGTYVEVDMYGLPADTVRRKCRTKTVPNNGLSPIYDEEPFRFQKVVLPSLAVLRIAVYEEGGKLIGHRVLPVDAIQPGYRHIKLRSDSNQALCLPVLFVHIVTTDYVPSGFSDFADALANPIAFQSKAEIRGHMLESLMDDDDTFSLQPTEKQPKLAPAPLPANTRRPSAPYSCGVPTSKSSVNLNGAQYSPSGRSVSLTGDQLENCQGPVKMLRSQSTKKREEEPKIVPVPIDQLREHKNLQKVKEKHRKDMTMLVRRHMREKDRVQRQHFSTQEKLAKEMEKDVEFTNKKLEKALKKASKNGNYEEVYKEGALEISKVRKENEMRMNVLKLEQREEVIALLEKQLKEQHDLAKESVKPEFDELRVVMDITKNKQTKKLAEQHERKINDMKKRQDLFDNSEFKYELKGKKSKEEIQRLKREHNKRHIEQAVKERQKANEFHEREMEQLKESHDKLLEELEEVKEKSFEELLKLFDKRCRNIHNADLEIVYATLYAEEEESKL